MTAKSGARYCFAHDPAKTADRAAARKLGGLRRAVGHGGDPATIPAKIASIDDAGALLSYVLAELLVMDNGIPRARALLDAYEKFLKSISIGNHEERLRALEAKS